MVHSLFNRAQDFLLLEVVERFSITFLLCFLFFDVISRTYIFQRCKFFPFVRHLFTFPNFRSNFSFPPTLNMARFLFDDTRYRRVRYYLRIEETRGGDFNLILIFGDTSYNRDVITCLATMIGISFYERWILL